MLRSSIVVPSALLFFSLATIAIALIQAVQIPVDFCGGRRRLGAQFILTFVAISD